jgi:hypothetical protein
MVLLDPGPVQQWLDEHHGGDKLIAFTRVITPANYEIETAGVSSGGGNVGSTEATRQMLGLDLENKSWLLGGRAGLLTITATHFYVLRLGGLKEKIKETIFDAPRSQMQFTANDLRIHKLDWRHWLVTGFHDGKYLLEPQVMGKMGKPSKVAPGSDALVAELGEQVQHLTGDAPTA